MVHSLFDTTKSVTLLFIVQSLINRKPQNIRIKNYPDRDSDRVFTRDKKFIDPDPHLDAIHIILLRVNGVMISLPMSTYLSSTCPSGVCIVYSTWCVPASESRQCSLAAPREGYSFPALHGNAFWSAKSRNRIDQPETIHADKWPCVSVLRDLMKIKYMYVYNEDPYYRCPLAWP